MTAMKRLSMTNADTRMNGMKKSHALGCAFITGTTTPSAQLSSVITRKSVSSDAGIEPNISVCESPNSTVAITAPT